MIGLAMFNVCRYLILQGLTNEVIQGGISLDNGKKRVNPFKRIVIKTANFKTFLILSFCYFVINLFSEYLHWIRKLLTFPYILDMAAAVIMLIVFLLAILIFIRILMDNRVRVAKKIIIFLILICVLAFLIYVPAVISQNFISDGVILD